METPCVAGRGMAVEISVVTEGVTEAGSGVMGQAEDQNSQEGG